MLSKKLRDNFANYTASEMLEILDMHSNPDDLDTDIFELAESYLVTKLPNLTVQELIELVKCFNKP